MAKPTARGKPKTTIEWAEERLRDPEHQHAIEALMTEIDLRQDLIALREAQGLTQVQLAQKLGVTQPTIANLEGRRTTDVKLSTLVKVAAALGGRVKITLERHAAGSKKAVKRKRAAA